MACDVIQSRNQVEILYCVLVGMSSIQYDSIFSRDSVRSLFLGNQVDDFTADAVISQLLLLDAQDPKKVRCFTFYKLNRCFRRSVFKLKTT